LKIIRRKLAIATEVKTGCNVYSLIFNVKKVLQGSVVTQTMLGGLTILQLQISYNVQ